MPSEYINKKSLRFETEPQLESLMTQKDEGSIEAFFVDNF